MIKTAFTYVRSSAKHTCIGEPPAKESPDKGSYEIEHLAIGWCYEHDTFIDSIIRHNQDRKNDDKGKNSKKNTRQCMMFFLFESGMKRICGVVGSDIRFFIIRMGKRKTPQNKTSDEEQNRADVENSSKSSIVSIFDTLKQLGNDICETQCFLWRLDSRH